MLEGSVKNTFFWEKEENLRTCGVEINPLVFQERFGNIARGLCCLRSEQRKQRGVKLSKANHEAVT